MVSEPTQPRHPYALDNASDDAAIRMVALAELYDAGTFQILTRLGVPLGWNCLEVGAGGPSVPLWLADQVGPSGSVLVTDINPRFLAGIERGNVEVRTHDITVDPVPAQAFDLVHSRLVLQHVGAQERALEQMVTALRPGGWLVVEDFGSERLARDPDFPAPEVLTKVRANCAVARAPGVQLPSLHRLLHLFRRLGLEAIGCEGRIIPHVGGEAGGRLAQANYRQRWFAQTTDNPISRAELDEALALLDDPATVLLPAIMWAVWGRRPSTVDDARG